MTTIIRKKLTTVGNSKGIILNSEIIQEFGLENEVIIEKLKDGLLIRAYKPTFQTQIDEMRKNKSKIYKAMEKQANSKAVQEYYADPDNITDIDNFIID